METLLEFSLEQEDDHLLNGTVAQLIALVCHFIRSSLQINESK